MEKFIDKLMKVKNWLLGLGVFGIALWYIIKILICFFTGVCII